MQVLRLCNNLNVEKVQQYDFIYILKDHISKFLHFYLLTEKKLIDLKSLCRHDRLCLFPE